MPIRRRTSARKICPYCGDYVDPRGYSSHIKACNPTLFNLPTWIPSKSRWPVLIITALICIQAWPMVKTMSKATMVTGYGVLSAASYIIAKMESFATETSDSIEKLDNDRNKINSHTQDAVDWSIDWFSGSLSSILCMGSNYDAPYYWAGDCYS